MLKTLHNNGINTADLKDGAFDSQFLIPTTKIQYCQLQTESIGSSMIFVHVYPDSEEKEYNTVLFLLNPKHLERFEKDMVLDIIEHLFEDKDILNDIENRDDRKVQKHIAYLINTYIQSL